MAVKLLPRKYPRALAADPVSVSIYDEGAKVPNCTPVDIPLLYSRMSRVDRDLYHINRSHIRTKVSSAIDKCVCYIFYSK